MSTLTAAAPFVPSGPIDPRNPPPVYRWIGPTGVQFTEVREPSGTYYREGTARAVIDALESAMRTGASVRLFTGDPQTGASWHDEYEVSGTVGRSMGPLKVALLCGRGKQGGGAILTDCIVRLMVNGADVYRHPRYTVPTILIGPSTVPSHPYAATVDGQAEFARFKTERAALRWVRFMRGETMTP